MVVPDFHSQRSECFSLQTHSDDRAERELSRMRRASLGPAALCGLIYLLAFLALASVLLRRFGFPLDDSWIHQVIARNLAQYHVLGFTAGRVSPGSSSPLWTLLLTCGWMVFPRLSPVVFSLVVSCVVLAGIGFVLKRLTEDDGLHGAAGWSVALAPAACGNFLWFGLIGMEHLLFILLSLCLVRGWFAPEARRGGVNLGLLGVASLLLVLTRPEGVVLVGLLLLGWRAADRPARNWMAPAAGAGCAEIVAAALNWRTSGKLLPQTMQGRQFLAGEHMGLRGRLYFLGQGFARLLKNWSFGASNRVLHGRGLIVGAALFLLVAVLVAIAIRNLRARRANRFLLFCVWGAVIELLYFAMLPNTGHGGRYISVTLMAVYSLLAFGAVQLLAGGRPGLRLGEREVRVALGVLLAGSAAVSMTAWWHASGADIEQINSEHGVMAQWLQQNLPAADFSKPEVAVFDIGRIGYQFHGNIVDLGGLVDRGYMPYLLTHRTGKYLQGLGVEDVVLPTDTDEKGGGSYFADMLSLDARHGVELTEVHTVCADPAVYRLAFASSETAFHCQSLFRIRYGAAVAGAAP
jgi:hypothetical protein